MFSLFIENKKLENDSTDQKNKMAAVVVDCCWLWFNVTFSDISAI